jgi:hypothetical protein
MATADQTDQVRKVGFSGNEMTFIDPASASGGKGVVNVLRRAE